MIQTSSQRPASGPPVLSAYLSSFHNLICCNFISTAYKKAIYEDLYPERDKKWEYIPKTLIFAKDDNHAEEIVRITREKIETIMKILKTFIPKF